MSRLVQPTRILIVGGGGREHALAWKLAAEPGVNEVVVAPGSDAIAHEPRVRVSTGVDPLDSAALVGLARERAVEVAVIGPEAPLAAGVADALVAAGVATFGPTAAAARIESSKAFCREIAMSAGVPMATGRAFAAADRAAATDHAADVAARGGVVVKEDGLAAGKGVTVCDTAGEAVAAIAATDAPLVIEERLRGREATVIAICDGRIAIALPPARDHKRLGDGRKHLFDFAGDHGLDLVCRDRLIIAADAHGGCDPAGAQDRRQAGRARSHAASGRRQAGRQR